MANIPNENLDISIGKKSCSTLCDCGVAAEADADAEAATASPTAPTAAAPALNARVLNISKKELFDNF